MVDYESVVTSKSGYSPARSWLIKPFGWNSGHTCPTAIELWQYKLFRQSLKPHMHGNELVGMDSPFRF